MSAETKCRADSVIISISQSCKNNTIKITMRDKCSLNCNSTTSCWHPAKNRRECWTHWLIQIICIQKSVQTLTILRRLISRLIIIIKILLFFSSQKWKTNTGITKPWNLKQKKNVKSKTSNSQKCVKIKFSIIMHLSVPFSTSPFPRCIILMCLSKHKYLFYATWWVSFGCCCHYFYSYYNVSATHKWPNNVVTWKA